MSCPCSKYNEYYKNIISQFPRLNTSGCPCSSHTQVAPYINTDTPQQFFTEINNELRNNPSASYIQEFAQLLKSIMDNTLPVPAPTPTEVPTPPTKEQYKVRFTRPIYLGVSGGSITDRIGTSSVTCCGGTIGCALYDTNTGKQYLLSNKHVFASDIISGANNRIASVGDSIRQPALIDNSCANTPSDEVARLYRWKNITERVGSNPVANLIDASVAESLPGRVRSDGYIFGIGVIAPNPLPASIGMRVKKAGRTTGLTFGVVIGLNATIDVIYTRECASTRTFISRFTNQIVIGNENGEGFSDSGDSGSLVVSNDTNPAGVGLLFAGSSTTTFANRITDVLDEFQLRLSPSLAPASSETTVDEELEKVISVQNKNSDKLFSLSPNCFCHYIGKNSEGGYQICLVSTDVQPLAENDQKIEGIPIVVSMGDKIKAL